MVKVIIVIPELSVTHMDLKSIKAKLKGLRNVKKLILVMKLID